MSKYEKMEETDSPSIYDESSSSNDLNANREANEKVSSLKINNSTMNVANDAAEPHGVDGGHHPEVVSQAQVEVEQPGDLSIKEALNAFSPHEKGDFTKKEIGS